MLKNNWLAGCRWVPPVILATQEAEIRRTVVRSQPGEIVHDTLSQKSHQKRAGGVVQGVGPEFNSTRKKKKANILQKRQVTKD
jgi:hypothetical protein